MQFLVTAYDYKDEGAYERRMSVRPKHLENLAGVMEKGKIICAGGIKDSEGRLIGSVLIMDFENREMLDEYLAGEPYVAGKVWEDIRVETCAVVITNNEFAGK